MKKYTIVIDELIKKPNSDDILFRLKMKCSYDPKTKLWTDYHGIQYKSKSELIDDAILIRLLRPKPTSEVVLLSMLLHTK